ncbi:MAG: 4Fe-4S binding protein [Spirochaetales bacterium]|nr:4Fe-4S binding protein [Spirochaetales bacterium]
MNNKAIPIFLITLAYFLLPFVNILFALTAIACMALPFIILRITRKKTWCRGLCPRADFFTKLRPANIGFRQPKWFNLKKIAIIMLYYFGINIFFITMSTIMVGLGRINPIDRIRLLIMFQLPWELPQLFTIAAIPAPLLHLSYRFYSLMLTSTLLGSILAVLFKPKTWCAVCPINSISEGMLSSMKRKEIITNE